MPEKAATALNHPIYTSENLQTSLRRSDDRTSRSVESTAKETGSLNWGV